MTISSPSYPKWYKADGVGCEWQLRAPDGFFIVLEFKSFHVSKLPITFREDIRNFFIIIYIIIISGCKDVNSSLLVNKKGKET